MRTSADHERRFREWLVAHRGIIAKVARSFADPPADAADLEQQMLLQLWLALPSFAGEAKPSTWIYRVCLNTAMMWRRGTQRRERHLDRGADVAELAAPQATPADHAGDRERLDRLYTAIRALPDFDRALVLLSLDGLAYREMAEITGLTENHVGVALTRARKRLAQHLEGVAHELE